MRNFILRLTIFFSVLAGLFAVNLWVTLSLIELSQTRSSEDWMVFWVLFFLPGVPLILASLTTFVLTKKTRLTA